MQVYNHATKGRLAIVIASFLWGTTGTSAHFLTGVSPLAIGAFAMGLGGLLLVLASYQDIIRDMAKLKQNKSWVLLGGLGVALYPLAFYSAMNLAGVAIGTVISIASAPLFTVLLERVFNQKPITVLWLIKFTLGVIGVYFLVAGKSAHFEPIVSFENTSSPHHSTNTNQLLGVLLGLVAGFTYALYAWVARNLIEKGTHSKSAMGSVFGVAALLLLPPLLFIEHHLFATPQNASIALYMAVFPMFVGYLLFGYGLKHIDASQATLITLLEPAIATVMAVIVVGERFSITGWLGVCLIIASLGVYQLPNALLRQRVPKG